MRPGARIKAAEEVLDEVLGRHRPVSLALADWGKAHRFAGSGDRNAIGHIVYDALRRRASTAWRMDADTPRALALGAASAALGLTAAEIPQLCDGDPHAPGPLDAVETRGLTRNLAEAPAQVQADVPEWLWPRFVEMFGDRAIAEGRAMAERAPADLRVNSLKSTRDKVAKALAEFHPLDTPHSPLGLRIAPPTGPARTPNLEAEAAFQAGWFEIQDEGSQIAAALSGAGPRLQVLDLCAGSGGKTLALAAAMQNTGQLYVYDEDRNRLKPIFDRIKRAGVRNVQVLRGGDEAALIKLGPRFDVVLVDAPCTGSGTWRRRPEAKWRLKPGNLADRQAEQIKVLGLAATLVKPGGCLVYVTCSVLADENSGQVAAFLDRQPQFSSEPAIAHWRGGLAGEAPASATASSGDGLQLTPASHGTDGFFVARLVRRA